MIFGGKSFLLKCYASLWTCCECSVDKALQTVDSEQPAATEDLTISELQQQLEEIQCEMEKRTERAAKYKRLYSEERKKCEEVMAQLQMLQQVDLSLYHLR